MILILRDFNHIIDRNFFKNWQANTSEVDLNLYGEHMPEERIIGSKTDHNLSVGLTDMRVFTVHEK